VTVIIRFWILAGLLAMLGLASSTVTSQDREGLDDDASNFQRDSPAVAARQLQRAHVARGDDVARRLWHHRGGVGERGPGGRERCSSFSIILRDLVYLGFGLFALYVVARLRLARVLRSAPLLILLDSHCWRP